MSIQEGDKIPGATLHSMRDGKPTPMTTEEIFAGKKVVLFAVPGAFTPTCSMAHLPGYVVNADSIKAKGVDTIACISVNDAFVMSAWGDACGVGDKVDMLSDGNGEMAAALGLVLDASGGGLGIRIQRFAAIVEDGVVTALNLEKPGAFEVSNAETILDQV